MSNNFFSFFSSHKSSADPIKVLTPEMFAFLEQLPSALLLLDEAGKIAFSNARAAELLQTQTSALNGARVDRFGLTMDQVRSMSQERPPKQAVIQLVNPQADSVFVSAWAGPLAQTPFTMLTLEAVPYFKQLTAEKNFLHGVLEHYPVPVTVHNAAGVCVLCNTAAETLFGKKAGTLQGQPLSPALPKELVASLERVDSQVRAKQQVREGVQLSYKDATGQEHVLTVTKVLTPAENGKGQNILTVYEDITARYRHEQNLLQNRTLLRAVLENVPLGLYTRDCDGEMTFFNKQSMRVLGESDIKCVNEAHPYQDKDIVKQNSVREQEVLAGGVIRDYPNEPYTDHAGKEHILHLIKVPLMDAGPKPLVLSIVEDVTETRRQEKEIARANSFLAAILQNAPIGLYARAADGKILLRNKQCTKIFGVESESDFDEKGTLPHETQDQTREYFSRERELLETGKTLDIPEEAYKTAANETKILHMVKVPVLGTHGIPNFVVTLVDDITQRKAQERALMETKNSMQTILDQVPVAIYARNAAGKVIFVNQRTQELFPDEYAGNNQEITSEFYDHREASVLKTGKLVDFPEEWYTTKRGKKILIHLIKAPVFDKDGKPFLVLTVAEDITEKKAQERAIVDAKDFLQTVINNLPVSLSVKNYDGKYVLWNKKSEELFGVTAADVIGRTSYRADLNKDQAEFLRGADLRVFESKKEQNIPQELISTATEGVKIMHTVKTPLYRADGTPNYLLVVSEDITAKTKMEKQIREASDKNTLLVENAREGIVILEDEKVIYANRSLCHLLGYDSIQELLGKNLLSLAVEDHRGFLKDKYETVRAGGEGASSAIEVRFIKKNGTTLEAEFAAVASKYLGRRIVLCFVRDVTSSNRILREVKADRECFRSAFEQSVSPAFILTHKGYIRVMNQACRELFGLTEADKNFYRNVYMRPAITLAARRLLKTGQPARMQYLFDFARAEKMFPGRLQGTGKIPLTVFFVPINKRDTKDGTVEADYVVFLERTDTPLPPSKTPAKPLTPPAPPMPIIKTDKELLVLPNSEPYALCSTDWKIDVCNDLFCSLCQLSAQELHNQDLRHLFDTDELTQLEADLQDLAKQGSLANREYHIRLASGLERTAVRMTAIKEADGRYLFVFRSMVFQRQIMKILEERSAQLNALLDATDGVVFSVLLENGCFGLIEQANKQLSQKLGFSHDELVHMMFKDLFFAQDHKGGECAKILQRAQEDLVTRGKASFRLNVRKKDGSSFDAQAVLTLLDLPGKDAALVVLRDLSETLEAVSKDSKEALELKSVRQALPGLYLKTDSNGRALEVYSNLDYLTNEQAETLFLDKKPGEYWPSEAASRALFSIKEALSINISSRFEFEWQVAGKVRYYEAMVTPIFRRAEAVLWIKDVSDKHAYDEKIHELYRLSSQPNLTITEQVDKILAFGCKTFATEVGLVMRFEQGKAGLECHIVYVTPNKLNLERYMQFPLEECLMDVPDGNVVICPDLGNTSCTHCLHKEKGLGSLVAAPLYVGGKVMGALCFASKASRSQFADGAEELLGIMSRLLSLRIELRQTGKMLGEASRSLARTLEFVEMPAVMMDLDYQITFVNRPFLEATGRRTNTLLGRDLFAEVIRNDDISKRMFKSAENSAAGNAFQVRMDLLQENGLYKDTGWDVFACKNEEGKVEAYALIASD